MCVSAGVAAGITAGMGIFSAIGGYYDAKSQNSALEYNARVNDINAQYALQDAEYARGQGQRSAVEKRREIQTLIGAQRAKAGASGATVNSGSFADVQLSTAEEGEKDAMAILQQADLDAWRYETQANQYRQQGYLYRSSKVNPGSVLAGGLLSAGAQAATTYYSFSKFGGSGSPLNGSSGTGVNLLNPDQSGPVRLVSGGPDFAPIKLGR